MGSCLLFLDCDPPLLRREGEDIFASRKNRNFYAHQNLSRKPFLGFEERTTKTPISTSHTTMEPGNAPMSLAAMPAAAEAGRKRMSEREESTFCQPCPQPTKRAATSSRRLSPKEAKQPSEFVPRGDSKGGGPARESFESVLAQFAAINLNKAEPTTRERCFLCGVEVLLKNFAQHMHGCVDKLRQQEEAAELANLAAAGVDVCYPGCARRDYQHFMAVYHPLATCPCCNEGLPLYEIDAHLNLCLESTAVEEVAEAEAEAPYASSPIDGGGSSPGGMVHIVVNDTPYTIDLNQLTQTNLESGRERLIMRTDGGVWKWRNNYGLYVPFDPVSSRRIERGMETMTSPAAAAFETANMGGEHETSSNMDEPTSAEPGLNMDASTSTSTPTFSTRAEASKEERKLTAVMPTKEQKSGESQLERKMSPAGALPKLTKTQMAACAALIVKEKRKPDIEKTVSLARLMQSFKALGITKENLKKEL